MCEESDTALGCAIMIGRPQPNDNYQSASLID